MEESMLNTVTVSAMPRPCSVSTIVKAAWCAVLLGICVQVSVVAARLATGVTPSLVQAVSAIAGGIAWSTIVCCGLVVGSAASRHRDASTGLFGLISAPLGWAAAKGIQRAAQSLSGAAVDALTPLVFQVAAAKAIEYALLGYMLSRLSSRSRTSVASFAMLGFGFGCIFGSIIFGLEYFATGGGLTWPKAMTIVVNELIFPVGCSTVVFIVTRLSHIEKGTKGTA
jgi:hypothetical protein